MSTKAKFWTITAAVAIIGITLAVITAGSFAAFIFGMVGGAAVGFMAFMGTMDILEARAERRYWGS